MYWFLGYKPLTNPRENGYVITMVNHQKRQIAGHIVNRDKRADTIQRMVDEAAEAMLYCTDGFSISGCGISWKAHLQYQQQERHVYCRRSERGLALLYFHIGTSKPMTFEKA